MTSSGANYMAGWQPVHVPTDAASWDVGTPAFVLADVAPTLPLTIVLATNDTFQYTPNGGSAETFTLAPGVLTTITACVAAMAAATGSVSGERFDTKITPSVGATKILLTSKSAGVTSNGDTITEGDGGAAALGFTANPDTFAGGTGQLGIVSFNGDGSITLGANSAINSKDDIFATAWAAEVEVLLEANSEATFLVGFDAINNAPIGTAETAGTGPMNVYLGTPGSMSADTYGNSAVYTPALAVGAHIIRVVGTQPLSNATLDGVFLGHPSITPAVYVGASSRFYLSSGSGDPVTFSNLKAWRIPVPVL